MRADASVPDEVLVRRSLSGDDTSYGDLVERYGDCFYRYATAICADADQAEDCLQEAFIRAYRSLARCREPQRFRAWLFRILTNTCHDACAGAHPTVDLECVELPTTERSDDGVERQELASRIRTALEGLTPAQRQAFVLHYVEGYRYDEMARLTGTTVDALKMRVHRARRVLRHSLGGSRDASHLSVT